MRKIFLILFIFCFNDSYSQVSILRGQDTTRRPIITAVPFLLISPDSRGSAMGETGVATSPDANSVHWNNAKLAFVVLIAVPLVLVPIIVFGKKVRKMAPKIGKKVTKVKNIIP